MEDARKAERIARRLNSSYPAHQYPITSREARRLGLKVQEIPAELDSLLQQLNLLYSARGPRAARPRPKGPGDPRRARQPAAAAEPALLGDGPARDHRLRRGEPPRQRDHEHPRRSRR